AFSSSRSRCRSSPGARRSENKSRLRANEATWRALRGDDRNYARQRNVPVTSEAVERPVLEDLAAASRILVDQGVFDAAGHISMRHPQLPDRFLMSRSLAPEMVTANDIMQFDLDCEPIDAQG